MIRRLVITAVFITGLAYTAKCQNVYKAENVMGRVSDNALGISFAKVGEAKKIDSSTYGIALQSSANPSAGSARAEVSVSERLFVDLPGSYGGKLYYDRLAGSRLADGRIFTDTVATGQTTFTREYWAVYAGMGMWEGVINCYAREGGQYYVVSLLQDRPLGKPGEVVGGSTLRSAQLKTTLLAALRDTSDTVVRTFNKLLASVEIQH